MGTIVNDNTKSQCDMILQYMRDFGSISQIEAASEIGCYRLSGRIYDLRARGYTIKREMQSRKNRYGKSVSFARYSLVKEELPA